MLGRTVKNLQIVFQCFRSTSVDLQRQTFSARRQRVSLWGIAAVRGEGRFQS
jgi:hypothetical protein